MSKIENKRGPRMHICESLGATCIIFERYPLWETSWEHIEINLGRNCIKELPGLKEKR